ncbi:nucleotidyl transferase AbiEii/AbiGii toxin family protein [Aliidiomarina soli]|uniref:Nucleotidyl transferase AbiEii/AbiGii toxin family protein n=1 Tax=Aliidiomarina soli TaxID=1928574 RepID=A0A432WM21_9GAMM|nr:nucleotidyl transferase AbiEii/AbiGii toxin family protein [Aliidiomarina soli]RUO34872.1 nucleotidyl transferase AbiEii/AbiGii toxin family protein [Aliidiomarina soli]
MSLNYKFVDEIAAELGIDPAFVEKDWYSVQVLKTVAEHQSEFIETLFAGGTSLSKGYGLIQRFSEDLDFRCRYTTPSSGNQNKKVRSAYRSGMLDCIQAIDHIELDESKMAVASKYIKFPMSYPQQYDVHASLRPNLEIEFSFTQPRLPAQKKPIQSLIAKFTGGSPETEILCLSPIETGADKLSALTWRVLKRDRSHASDDPAMIRHLHDLCALNSVIEQEQALFIDTAHASFEGDQETGKRDTEKALYPSLQSVLAQLQSDSLYRQEYQQFVDAMSYANDEDMISFDHAVTSLEAMISLFEA